MTNKHRVLLIIESCNPEWSSVPLVGYRFFNEICKVADVHLVTHRRNKPALNKLMSNTAIEYIEEGKLESSYYSFVEFLTTYRGRVIWPLYHVLCFPLYFFFDRAVAQKYKSRVQQNVFDVIHVVTPMMPRYPVGLSRYSQNTPFVLGPVNGGVPFPKAFKARGRREFSQLNFLRKVGAWLIPNYRSTYKTAAKVLSGSTYTRNWIAQELGVPDSKLSLMYENGVEDQFFERDLPTKLTSRKDQQCLTLIFSGRLVPYKGADMLLHALADESLLECKLVILGDGPERPMLEALAQSLSLSERVEFVGWINQSDTHKYYEEADIFAFPSVREFGGAVVMEAMAHGLPCVVVNNGGIGEYVDATCGFKISPQGESFVIDECIKYLSRYVSDRELLAQHSLAALERAQGFAWSQKSHALERLYDDVVYSGGPV